MTQRTQWHFLMAGAISLACSSCAATSRMGNAAVTEADGLPCFALPQHRATKNGLPLDTLYVSETRSPDNGVTLPAELWHISAAEGAAAPQLRPQGCISYGKAPAATVQRSFKPLELYRPYHVAIRTQGDNAGMVAYTAEFCLKPDASGKARVLVVPRDGSSDDKRFSVCARAR